MARVDHVVKACLAAKLTIVLNIHHYLGEFGTCSGVADLAARIRWTGFIAREAEAHGFKWAYWEYRANFGGWDPSAQAWRRPLLDALLPPAR